MEETVVEQLAVGDVIGAATTGTSKISGVSLHAKHTITRLLSKSGRKTCPKKNNAYESFCHQYMHIVENNCFGERKLEAQDGYQCG